MEDAGRRELITAHTCLWGACLWARAWGTTHACGSPRPVPADTSGRSPAPVTASHLSLPPPPLNPTCRCVPPTAAPLGLASTVLRALAMAPALRAQVGTSWGPMARALQASLAGDLAWTALSVRPACAPLAPAAAVPTPPTGASIATRWARAPRACTPTSSRQERAPRAGDQGAPSMPTAQTPSALGVAVARLQ